MTATEEEIQALVKCLGGERATIPDLGQVIEEALTGQQYTRAEDHRTGALVIVTAEPLSREQKDRILNYVPMMHKMVFAVEDEPT